jgi:predicted ArsR family transcriptional regulator
VADAARTPSGVADPAPPALADIAGAEAPASADEGRFSAAVAAVTAAFGDPTRREIYLHVRSHPGVTASDVAAAFSLHPNVARHHLDRLAAGGYLAVTLERPADGGAGRPSKHYRSAEAPGSDPTVELVGRRDELLVSLLAEALTMLGPDEAERMAERVGEEYGRLLAERMEPGEGQRSLRAAMHAIADALTAHGFAAHAEDRGASTAVVAEHCPFGEAAMAHPVICAVDRGMVRGLLSSLCGVADEAIPVVLSSRARGDDACAALV